SAGPRQVVGRWPADRRPTPAQRSAEPSDDAPPSSARPQKTMGPPDRRAASAPARPDSPVPFATAQSRATPPNPPRPSPVRSHAANPPSLSSLVSESNGEATSEVTKTESYAYDWFH